MRLEQLGILQKVNHSDWAAPGVVVSKGYGCLRVCGYYKVTVNPVLVVDKYPLPKPDNLMAQLEDKGSLYLTLKSDVSTDLVR